LIRPAEGREDYSACADIWLAASLLSHDFIPADFWRRNRESMLTDYLPGSQVFIRDLGGCPAAFAAVKGDYLAALFVRPEFWGRGLGAELLENVLNGRKIMRLNVYQRNRRAVDFYRRFGFAEERKSFCPHTGQLEISMVLSKVKP